MKWSFDHILGRAYFWAGVAIALYGAFAGLFKLPLPVLNTPDWFGLTLIGLVLMLIGTNWLRGLQTSKVEIDGEVVSAETTGNLTITNRKPEGDSK